MSTSSDSAPAAKATGKDGRSRRGPIRWVADGFRAIALFVRQVVAELRKVVYPTRSQLITYTTVVLVFVAIIMIIVSVMDLALGQVIREILG